MAEDYYKILGIEKNASEEEIKKAYRKLVHKHHPDKGGSEDEFKKVNEAYQVLSNSQKRKQYDTFGSAGGGNFGGFNANDFNFQGSSFSVDLEDLFSGGGFEGVFENFFGGGRTRVKRRIETLNITLEEAYDGLEREVDFGDGKKFKISIPKGIDNGTRIKVGSDKDEELHVRVNVLQHASIKRHGLDIVVDCNIKLSESLLGVEQKVKLIKQEISVKIPSGVKSGETLRVSGKGMQNSRGAVGDAYLRIIVETPKKVSRRAKKLLEELQDEGL